MVMPPRIGPRTPARVFLKEWRLKYGFKLEKFGNRFDPPIPKGTVKRIEDNPRPPAVNVLAAWAEALDPDLEWTVLAHPPPEDEPKTALEVAETRLEEALSLVRKAK